MMIDVLPTGVRATVLEWDQAPPIDSPMATLALLVCNAETGQAKLYVNTGVGYDLRGVAAEANALIDAFRAGDRDDKWEDCEDGSFARFLPAKRIAGPHK